MEVLSWPNFAVRHDGARLSQATVWSAHLCINVRDYRSASVNNRYPIHSIEPESF